MSKWANLRDFDAGFLHCVPVDNRGYVLPPHVLTEKCECVPKPHGEVPELIIHNDRARGGCDA